jgi:ABC-type transporter Mla subunit MlaD
MSGERKRVIIRRRPTEGQEEQEPQVTLDSTQLKETFIEAQQPVQPQATETGDTEVEAILVRARDVYEDALQRFNEFFSRIERLRERDRSIQSAYMKMEELVRLAVVKKKLDELNDERSAILASAGPAEQKLTQAMAELESVVSDLEQLLFDKLVELEELSAARSSGAPAGPEVRAVEEACNRIRSEIAKTRGLIEDLRKKVQALRDLPKTIYRMTTYRDLAEEYYKQLKSQKGIDEARLEEHLKKVMQEEQVPWEYAVLYLYKRLMKRTERPQ